MEDLEELDRFQQGLLLAALIDSGSDAGDVLARVKDGGSERCRAVYGSLRRRSASHRRRAALTLSQQLFSPIPANLDQVHPSWLRHHLEQQSPSVARIVVDTLPSAIPARLGVAAGPNPVLTDVPGWVRPELCRRALAQIEPMYSAAARLEADPRRLARLTGRRLAVILSDLGLLVLAQSVDQADDPQLPETVAASLPLALRQRFQRARHAVKGLPGLPHPPSLPARDGSTPMQERLRQLALQVVSPLLSPIERQQLAQRLPRGLGVTVTNPAITRSPPDDSLTHAVEPLLREAESWSQDR